MDVVSSQPRRQRPSWRALLDALLDLDLHLTASSGAVALVPADHAVELVEAFMRVSVHSIGRSSRGGGWAAAVAELAAALPGRGDLRVLIERGPSAETQVADIVDQLVNASRFHPFCLVLDHPEDTETWEVLNALADDHVRHGVLAVVVTDREMRRPQIGRQAAVARSLVADGGEPSDDLVVVPSEVTDVVRLLALRRAPMTIARLSRLLGVGFLEVESEIVDWERRGVVRRLPGHRSTVEVAPSVDQASLVATASFDHLRELHARLARELAGLDSEVGVLSDDAIAAAHHAFAADGDPELVVDACRRAAARCLERGNLTVAVELLQQALAVRLPPADRMEILCLLGEASGLLGESDLRQQAFDAALEIARSLDDIEPVAEVMARASVTASKLHGSGEEVGTVQRMIASLGERRPDLRALLHVREAELLRLIDPAGCRRAIERSLDLARDSGSAAVEVRAIRNAALLSTDHPLASDHVQVLERLADLGTPLAVSAGLHLRIAACLAAGNRASLDVLVSQFRASLVDHPNAQWDPDVDNFAAIQASFDGERDDVLARLVAMREATRRTGALGGYWTYPHELLWYLHTGAPLPLEPDPAIPVPAAGGVLDLFVFASHLVAAEMGDRDAPARLAAALPDLAALPVGEWTTPTWWPFIVRAAALLGDRSLAVSALERVRTPVDHWVLLGVSVPIGPCGYFVAEAHRLLGRASDARTAAAAGLAAAQRMRSQPWTGWCSLQMARLLHAEGKQEAALHHVDTARRIARAYGFASIEVGADRLASMVVGDLTGPELEVLQLVTQGMANKQIATNLGVSVKRIERLLSSAYRRLGVQNRAEAVKELLSRGVLHR